MSSTAPNAEFTPEQLEFTVARLADAKADLQKEQKAFNQASAEQWFNENINLAGHFEEYDQFLNCLNRAMSLRP
jgi:hypothetical protein